MIGRAPISTVAHVGLGLAWTLGRFGWARRNSPFRYLRNYPRVERPNCHRLITIISRRCSHYRTVPGAVSGPIHCSNCVNMNRSDAKFCTACGDRFEVSRR